MVPKSQEMCLSINTKYKHIFHTLFFTLCETKHSTFNVKLPLYNKFNELLKYLFLSLYQEEIGMPGLKRTHNSGLLTWSLSLDPTWAYSNQISHRKPPCQDVIKWPVHYYTLINV